MKIRPVGADCSMEMDIHKETNRRYSQTAERA
jgi:hypothetical protein